CLMAITVHAADMVGISSHNNDLMNQLRSCAENAVSQGVDTAEGIATQCSQEVAELDAALPNVSGYLIDALLN
ncbi:MAG: hypothetical protein QNK11_04905, partial [Legionella sp.]|nr:hypothetical protein [Legionella sp.]